MNQNRNSFVAVAATVCALFFVAITVTTQSHYSPTVTTASEPFPTNEATRADLPQHEKLVLTELQNSGLQIRDRFT